ncbi:hypothetical protein OG946_20260 [Streptomyces sp. NBC_01808]|uniref:hypothetical protein n=1 Tax=Streptomyces sp. NBC_01808 TaxID=2975947 RepID=UPI002DDAB298|nr:hypothetical protein [Streptomyces sp. NBC_01808]WSA39490.1 hypothetical protein OG946_20260 [Streptomyces sp. NBC_01808]
MNAAAPLAIDDQLDDTTTEPDACSECGRALKHPAADGLGPVCRRRLRAERDRASSTSTRYRVTYTRVGRHGGRDGSQPPGQLTVDADDADQLAEQVLKNVRPYLASRGVEVVVDLDTGRGHLLAGFSNAGTFTVEQIHAEGVAA